MMRGKREKALLSAACLAVALLFAACEGELAPSGTGGAASAASAVSAAQQSAPAGESPGGSLFAEGGVPQENGVSFRLDSYTLQQDGCDFSLTYPQLEGDAYAGVNELLRERGLQLAELLLTEREKEQSAVQSAAAASEAGESGAPASSLPEPKPLTLSGSSRCGFASRLFVSATYTADASVLGDYGLDTPAVTFTVTTTADEEQSTATLAFGKKGDNCYMRMDDSPIIYKVDADTYNDTIAAAGYDTLRPDEVLALNWDDVQSSDFTIDDTTYTVDKKGDTYQIGDDVVEFDDVSAAVDGLVVNEFNTESPSKKQEAAFTVHLDNDAFPTLTVTVYQYDGDNCLVQLDGTTLGLVSRSLVVDLTEAVNAITLGLA